MQGESGRVERGPIGNQSSNRPIDEVKNSNTWSHGLPKGVRIVFTIERLPKPSILWRLDDIAASFLNDMTATA